MEREKIATEGGREGNEKKKKIVQKKALSHAEAEEIKVANVDASAQEQSWEFCCCSSN